MIVLGRVVHLLLPVSFAGAKLVRLLAILLLMRTVSPDEFSQWIAYSLTLQYVTFLQLGVPAPAAREIAISFGREDDREVDNIASHALYFCLFAIILATVIISLQGLKIANAILVSYISLSLLSALSVTICRSQFYEHIAALSQFAEAFIIVICLFVFEITSAESLLLVFSLAALASLVITQIKLRWFRYIAELRKFALKHARFLIQSSWPLAIFGGLVLARSSWDVLLAAQLNNYDSSSYMSSQIIADISRVGAALCLLLYSPYVAAIYGRHHERISIELRNYVQRFTAIFFIIGAFAAVLVVFQGERFLANVLPQYLSGSNIFIFKAVGIAVGFMSLPCLIFLTIIRRAHLANTIISISIIMGGLAYFFLAERYSVEYSLLVASIFCQALSFCLSLMASFRILLREDR